MARVKGVFFHRHRWGLGRGEELAAARGAQREPVVEGLLVYSSV